MASPGGVEVGRASIRVVPDASGFRRDLNQDVQAAAQGVEAEIEVVADEDNLRTQIERIVDRASRGIEASIRVRWSPGVRVLRSELRALVRAASAGVTARVRVEYTGGGSRGLGASGLLSGGGGRGRFGPVQIAGYAAALLALAPALAAAGAAITAAWAALAAVIATLPALLFLLLAPIGAIALGVDGITEAAQRLQPAFERIQRTITGTFREGFGEVFRVLEPLFSEAGVLEAGLNRVAEGTNALALDLANLFLNAGRVGGELPRIFENAALAIERMAPGISSILNAILLTGADASAWMLLTNVINTFGREFENSVYRTIANGVLWEAIRQLEGLLNSLTTGFVYLVENGLRTMTTAGPGVIAFFDSLTAFFNRFDWELLGTAVSDVFYGLSEALNGVPQETIDAIEDGFARIGETMRSADFQTGIQTLVDSIPQALTLVDTLIQGFDDLALAADWALRTVNSLLLLLQDPMNGNAAIVQLLGPDGAEGFNDFVDQFFWTEWGRDLFSIPQEEIDRFRDDLAARGSAAATDAFGQIGGSVQEGTAGLGEPARAGAGAVPPAIGEGLGPAVPTAEGILAQLGPVFDEAFNGLGERARAGMVRVGEAVSAGSVDLANGLRNAVLALGSPLDVAFADLVQRTHVGMSLIAAAFIAGGTLLNMTFGLQLAQLGPTLTTSAANLVPAMDTLMIELNGAVLRGIPPIQATMATVPDLMRAQIRPLALHSTGVELMNGFVAGIVSRSPAVSTAVRNAVDAAVAAGRAAAGVRSPSRETTSDGRFWALGYVAGINRAAPLMSAAVSSFVSDALSAGQTALAISQLDLGSVWTQSLVDATPNAVRAAGQLRDATTGTFTSDFTSEINSDGFGGIADQVGAALAGWSVDIDGNGMARIVNKSNVRKARRR